MKKNQKRFLALVLWMTTLAASAQGTAFTYQGRLNDGASPANGSYDLRFRVALDPFGNNDAAPALLTNGVPVTNGLFTVTLDFGGGVFTGAGRWLEIALRTNGTGAFSTLSPLQPLTAAPHAIIANSAINLLGSLPAAQLTSIGDTNGGFGNFFVGPSGNSTTSGSANTANGFEALFSNTSGEENTADGFQALFSNTSGSANTANGFQALFSNTSGTENTANGFQALFYNTSGSENTANGRSALFSNKSGTENTANGVYALIANTNGSHNTANGYSALFANRIGSNNTALGVSALHNNTSGSRNIAIGSGAGATITTGNNNIDIGNAGSGNESDTIRIGTSQTKAFMRGISGGAIVNSSGLVCVDSQGLLGTVPTGGAVLAGNVQIGTGAGDYRRLTLGGGNSSGFLYGSFLRWGDGIHLGYNYHADETGANRIINLDGATSRLSVGYGSIVLATGGVGKAPTNQQLVVSTTSVTVNGTFNNNSDRNAKQDFTPVSPSQILGKVIQLPLSEWSYKEDPETRHLGPMAQDFYSAFNIGTDDKHLAPIDEGGVALAAIQGLNRKVEETRAENAELKQRLEKLEQLINRQDGGAR